jgi:hypothetical protein
MRLATILLVGLMLAGPARADEPKQQFVNGEPVVVQTDTAYVLARTNLIDGRYTMDAVLVRILSPDELRSAIERRQERHSTDADSNVVEVHGDDFYASSPDERVFVLALKPGTYILAGIATGGGAGSVCMCMGTVKFEAKAGVVTDIGLLLMTRDDEPTTIPELASHVRGKSIDVSPWPIVLGLRPYSAGMTIPEGLNHLPRVKADFRTVGWFQNYFGASVDRLAPVAGILDYDKDGHVLSLQDPTSGAQ